MEKGLRCSKTWTSTTASVTASIIPEPQHHKATESSLASLTHTTLTQFKTLYSLAGFTPTHPHTPPSTYTCMHTGTCTHRHTYMVYTHPSTYTCMHTRTCTHRHTYMVYTHTNGKRQMAKLKWCRTTTLITSPQSLRTRTPGWSNGDKVTFSKSQQQGFRRIRAHNPWTGSPEPQPLNQAAPTHPPPPPPPPPFGGGGGEAKLSILHGLVYSYGQIVLNYRLHSVHCTAPHTHTHVY